MLYHDRAFYLFGGNSGSNCCEQTIARFDADTQTWSKAGNLKNGRRMHGTIFDGEKFLILGGESKSNGQTLKNVKNEVCTLSGTSMTCEESLNSLEEYVYYPELFLVQEDFCKNV